MSPLINSNCISEELMNKFVSCGNVIESSCALTFIPSRIYLFERLARSDGGERFHQSLPRIQSSLLCKLSSPKRRLLKPNVVNLVHEHFMLQTNLRPSFPGTATESSFDRSYFASKYSSKMCKSFSESSKP